MIKNCYIHIPFCNSICSYCDFCKLLNYETFVDRYLDSLEKEIQTIYQKEPLETIYIGGGTPSCLSLHQLERLFQILSQLNQTNLVEYTIEGNFESTTKEKLALYKQYGINRLSFGLESIHPDNLDFLKRKASPKQIEEVIETARALGFSNINVDLMYALPKEDIDILRKDLDYILSLKVEHISTYSLIIEEHTMIYIQKIQSIEEDLDEKMYQMICNTLKENHYHHYEISNFAKPGKESIHNQIYWDNKEYYGFGLGASSYIGNERIENTRSFTDYIKGIVVKEKEVLSQEDKIEYEVLLNLRKEEGISFDDFKEKYNIDFSDCFNYEELCSHGFLVLQNNHLFIPEEKWYISNEIIVQLLERMKNE